jgi:hypothetical protein
LTGWRGKIKEIEKAEKEKNTQQVFKKINDLTKINGP